MKRSLILSGVLLLLTAALASAQPRRQQQQQQQRQRQLTAATQTPTTSRQVGPNFVDSNGDGICDRYQTRRSAWGRMGRGYGPGDGTGNAGVGPQDGTGYGAIAGAGKGPRAGTGTPIGRAWRGGRSPR